MVAPPWTKSVRILPPSAPGVRTLVDAVDIDVGTYWQTRIGDLIQRSNRRHTRCQPKASGESKVCLEEYSMASGARP